MRGKGEKRRRERERRERGGGGIRKASGRKGERGEWEEG